MSNDSNNNVDPLQAVARTVKDGATFAKNWLKSSESYILSDIRSGIDAKKQKALEHIETAKMAKVKAFGFYNFVKEYIKDTIAARHHAARNNYLLGREMLKENNLLDAKFRFLLANFFYKKSVAIKYCLAYVYFREDSFEKSLKYANECLKLRPTFKPVKKIIDNINYKTKI